MKAYVLTCMIMQLIAVTSNLHDLSFKEFPLKRTDLSRGTLKIVITIQVMFVFWAIWVL